MSWDPLLALTARCCLALLLLAAGIHKGSNLGGVRNTLTGYRTVPAGFEGPLTWAVIAIEVSVGACLLVPSTSRLASLVASGVFGVYGAVMVLSYVSGHRVMDCGCSFQHAGTPLSGLHPLRNALLVIVGVVGFEPISGRALSWVDGVQVGAAVASLSLVYLSVDSLLSHHLKLSIQEA
jgi:uncharacterized membrane protein YphA (DoxX/SURF4 family)